MPGCPTRQESSRSRGPNPIHLLPGLELCLDGPVEIAVSNCGLQLGAAHPSLSAGDSESGMGCNRFGEMSSEGVDYATHLFCSNATYSFTDLFGCRSRRFWSR